VALPHVPISLSLHHNLNANIGCTILATQVYLIAEVDLITQDGEVLKFIREHSR
jgi:hypothetical protein